MKEVNALPEPTYKGRQPDAWYDQLATMLKDGKVVMVDWDEVGKEGQDIKYKTMLVRGALARRGVVVSTRQQDDGLYLMKKPGEEAE